MNLYIYKHSYKTEKDFDTSFIPMLYRRKLSTFGKAALSTMYDVYENNDIKLVFASNYGDFEKTLKLIEQKNTEGEVSPNAFSFSVHNSTVGLFSLLNKIHSSYNTISAGENTFKAGLTESVITEGDVLFCYAEQVGGVKSLSLLLGSKEKDGAIKFSLDDIKDLEDLIKLLC